MIYITGDTHGLNDVKKLQIYFATKQNVTKNDFLIILGDVACCWDGNIYDELVQNVLHNLPCTVLWIDGNHCNFDIIEQLPYSEMFGGIVQKVTDDIIHLCRGQIYEIEGYKFFTFGGGLSIDRANRICGKSWWPQEMPTSDEYETGYINLDANDNEVDFILTHTAPKFICEKLVPMITPGEERLQHFLSSVANNTNFIHWYFGHWHQDRTIEKYTAVYNSIIELTPPVLERERNCRYSINCIPTKKPNLLKQNTEYSL